MAVAAALSHTRTKLLVSPEGDGRSGGGVLGVSDGAGLVFRAAMRAVTEDGVHASSGVAGASSCRADSFSSDNSNCCMRSVLHLLGSGQ